MKKKILIFSIAYHPFIGGAEVAVKEITKRLSEFDFTIITLGIDKNLPRREEVGNVTIYRIGLPSNTRLSLSLNWPLIVSKYLFSFWAFLKALKLNRSERFDMTWAIMANYAGFAALFFKLAKPEIPFLLTLQEGDPPAYIKRRVGPFMPLYRMIFSKANKIQAISHFLADYGKVMGHTGEILVVPNGVDTEIFGRTIKEEVTQKKAGEIILITTSRLVKKNAVDVIIQSLNFLPKNFKLFVAGQGEEEDKLRKLVTELKLESRVKFSGFIPYENLPPLLKAADIFVRPSRSEGLGNSFLEAMAVGIPVIGTPVGGIPDFLKDRQTGLLVKVDDPKDLAEKIKILSGDSMLRQKIVENSKKLVVEKYSWIGVAGKMKKIFNELCGS